MGKTLTHDRGLYTQLCVSYKYDFDWKVIAGGIPAAYITLKTLF